jgi:hypothetical protein
LSDTSWSFLLLTAQTKWGHLARRPEKAMGKNHYGPMSRQLLTSALGALDSATVSKVGYVCPIHYKGTQEAGVIPMAQSHESRWRGPTHLYGGQIHRLGAANLHLGPTSLSGSSSAKREAIENRVSGRPIICSAYCAKYLPKGLPKRLHSTGWLARSSLGYHTLLLSTSCSSHHSEVAGRNRQGIAKTVKAAARKGLRLTGASAL